PAYPRSTLSNLGRWHANECGPRVRVLGSVKDVVRTEQDEEVSVLGCWRELCQFVGRDLRGGRRYLLRGQSAPGRQKTNQNHQSAVEEGPHGLPRLKRSRSSPAPSAESLLSLQPKQPDFALGAGSLPTLGPLQPAFHVFRSVRHGAAKVVPPDDRV